MIADLLRVGIFLIALVLLYFLTKIERIARVKNKMPYWLKGGIILLVLFILSFLILKPSPYLPLALSPLTFLFKELHLLKIEILKILVLSADHFIVGTIIGFIYGKIPRTA